MKAPLPAFLRVLLPAVVVTLFATAASADNNWLNGKQNVFVSQVGFRPIGGASNNMIEVELDKAYNETGSNFCHWVRWRFTDSGWQELHNILTLLIAARISGLPILVYIDVGENTPDTGQDICLGGEVVLGGTT